MPNDTSGFRLSPQQRQLWNEHREGSVVQAAVTASKGLDLSALRPVLDAIISEQEILRTTYRSQAGSRLPLQVVHDHLVPDWREVDIEAVSPEDSTAQLNSVAEVECKPFDLEHGPIVRACIVRTGSQQVLTLTLPALCADRRTLQLILRELQNRLLMGRLSQGSDDAPLQYADYAEWQNEMRGTEDGGAAEARLFWETGYEDLSPILLPLENKPAADVPVDLRSTAVEISPECSAGILSVARAHETTGDSVLFACWQILLYRLSGQDRFSCGYTLNGRNYAELEGAFGRFARTVPVACRLAFDIPFGQLLSTVKKSQADARQWQDYLPDSGFAGASDFGIDFEPETPGVSLNSDGTEFSGVELRSSAGKYRLRLTCSQSGSRIHATLQYDSRVYGAETAKRLAGHLQALLLSALSDTKTPIGLLNLLSNSMRIELLQTWNATEKEYPSAVYVHTLFEAQAADTPDRLALVGEDGEYSYNELNSAANRLAHYLRDHGVGRKTRVGLLMDRSAGSIVALLGILKAGGAYVPLAHDAPKARLAHQLKQTEAPVVVTQAALRPVLSEYNGLIVGLDTDQLAAYPDSNLEAVNSSDDPVYVIYTSGSTGQPKGVENVHRGLVNYAFYIRGLIELDCPVSGMQFASVSPLTADLGNTCIFPCLTGGGTLHILSSARGMHTADFGSYVSRHRIDILKITPSHMNALLASPDGDSVLPQKVLFLGGEACPWELASRVLKTGKCRVVNHYGPTETTIGSLTYPITDRTTVSATVPIGRPIANTQVYILDPQLTPVPVGVAGELYIGGDGLARGYMGQQDLTEARFVPNPFATDGSLVYRTGDMVRYLPDGLIEFLGRLDNQVKIRGYRVEPGEIEAALLTHPAVGQAAVVARDDGRGEKQLLAYAVAGSGAVPIADELKTHLLRMLPDYMIPQRIVLLPSLPLGPNGKVDRAALPAPETVSSEGIRKRTLPGTPIEEQLVTIWQASLGRDDIGIQDDFFELGGHSLIAIQVMARVRDVFLVDTPLNALFDSPTISSLATVVEQELAIRPPASGLDRLIEDLDQLSEEEALELLSRESK